MTVVARILATALGAGYSPLAPGTCGTAVTVPVAFLMAGLGAPVYLCVTGAVILVGIWSASISDRHWGTHDSGRIVIDEVAGYLVTVALIDRSNWIALGAGFIVFRFFDIVKPPPVRQVDRQLGGGAGVVLDDVVAGIYGCAVMMLGAYLELWTWSV